MRKIFLRISEGTRKFDVLVRNFFQLARILDTWRIVSLIGTDDID